MPSEHYILELHKKQSTRSLNYRIERLLAELGIPTNVKGYTFLRRAVQIVYADPSAINKVVCGLYSDIAKEYETTLSCVERDIRTAISIMWSSNYGFLMSEGSAILGISLRRQPHAKELIALMSNKLRREEAESVEAAGAFIRNE